MSTYQDACNAVGIEEQNAIARLNEEINRMRQRVEFLKQNIVPNCENLPSDTEQEIKFLASEAESLNQAVNSTQKRLDEKRLFSGCIQLQKKQTIGSSGKAGRSGSKGTNGKNWNDREDCN